MSSSISVRRLRPGSGVLKHRDFRLLLIDRFLAPSAFQISVVGVSFAVLALTGSTADLSYVLAAQIAPTLVFAPISGVVADRIKPQYVVAAANLMVALCEGTLGLLVLTHHAQIWEMMLLEAGTGTAVAIFYPASQALLPRLVPDADLQQANAVSRLVMNGAMMGGAAIGGITVAAVGPGWALFADACGMLAAVTPNLLIKAAGNMRVETPGFFRELREGWQEFSSHTWLWGIVCEYGLVLMAWYGSFSVLGPAVAKAHLGGPAAWGAILSSESVGLIVGGLIALRFKPRRPMLFVAATGAAIAIPTLALAMLWPLWLICAGTLLSGILLEMMMVQWNLVMARYIPPDKLARVSAYDVLGSVVAMPAGALLAGPVAGAVGISATQYGAVVLIVGVSLLASLPRDIRTRRSSDVPPWVLAEQAEAAAPTAPETVDVIVGRALGDAAEVAGMAGAAEPVTISSEA